MSPLSGNNNETQPRLVFQPHHRPMLIWTGIGILILVLLLWFLHLYLSRQHKPPVKPQVVVTAAARSSNVPINIPALGQVQATYTVTVRTQVNGTLMRVNFVEGQMVKQGDLLAEIDPRPFEAQLIQFEGQLERDQALLANALVDLKRYKKLYPIGAVSQQVYATQVSLVKQLQGTVKFDQGQVDTVKVNLIYTRIISPIDGRVGLRLVDPGNLVQTSDTNGIVVVDNIRPICVVFTIPEDNIPTVLQQINAGKTLSVQAYDRTQNQLLATGTLLTMDNQIDPTTGTVKLKASYPNLDNTLFPNQFVNVQLLVTTLQNATVVPTAAVQNGPQGTFVFLVNSDNTVSVKPVKVGVTSGNDTVITSGITPGQIVVTDGTNKLTDGATITQASSNPSLPSPSLQKKGAHHHGAKS